MTSEQGIKKIAEFEGLKLKAYKDSGGVWTIGVGTIVYPNGVKVKKGDSITYDQAIEYFKYDLKRTEDAVNRLVKSQITQNQFDMLASLTYNIGITAFMNSTLLKKVNANPNNPDIKNQFLRWVFDNKKFVPGLLNRREEEAKIYFS